MGWFDIETPEEKRERLAKNAERIQKEQEEKNRIALLYDEKKARFIESELKMYENCMCMNESSDPYVYRGVTTKDGKWYLWRQQAYRQDLTGTQISETIMRDNKYIEAIKGARTRFVEFKLKLNFFKANIVVEEEIKQEQNEDDIQGALGKSGLWYSHS